MASLRYAVIALKKDEVEPVADKLNGSPFEPVAVWLKESRDSFYGPGNEDWKPFNGKTIDALINEKEGQYSNQTNLVNKFKFKEEDTDYDVVSPIRVYFIDAFALFHDKYFQLVNHLESKWSEGNQCCLVISDDWPKPVQQGALQRYQKVLPMVRTRYRQGFPHRIVMREDDLKNFRNYLCNTIGKEDLPAVSKEAQIKERFDYVTDTVPGREN